MKVEFLSKYGLASEYARLSSQFVAVLVSGVFLSTEEWDKVLPDPLKTEDDGSVSYMAYTMSTTGMLVASFESEEDQRAWCGHLATTTNQQTPILVTLIDKDGQYMTEFQAHEYQLKETP